MLAKAELLDRGTRSLIVDVLGRCASRKLECEAAARAGLQVLGAQSVGVSEGAADIADELLRKSAVNRPLFVSCVVATAKHDLPRAMAMWTQACSREVTGFGLIRCALEAGIPLSAWPDLGSESGRAFAVRIARASLGDAASAAALPSFVARVSEAMRMELCRDLLPALPRGWKPQAVAARAMWSLAQHERHTGRWLCFADIAARGGLPEPARIARARAHEYTGASAETWGFIAAWLDRKTAALKHAVEPLRLEALRKTLVTPLASNELRVGAELLSAQHAGLAHTLRALPPMHRLLPVDIQPWLLRARMGGVDAAVARAQATSALLRARTDMQRATLSCLLQVSGDADCAREVADGLLLSKALLPRLWSAVVRVCPDHTWEASLPLWDAASSSV